VHTHIALVEIFDVSLTEIVSAVARAYLQAAPVPEVYIEIDIGQHDH
jgi:hypothetical protein